MPNWLAIPHLTDAQSAAFWLVAALLILLVLLRQPKTLLIADDAKGRLEISRQALHRLVETCCEQLRGVASARARITRSRGTFKTVVHLRVRPDAKLDAIHGYLTEEIADIYRQNLGLKTVGPIEIKVTGISPAREAGEF